MSLKPFDATSASRIEAIAQTVLSGQPVGHPDAAWLFDIDSASDTFHLLAWANRIREHFKGNKVHLCSIVNIKSGGCPENCRFCAQSALYETESPRYGLVGTEPVLKAATEARSNQVTGLGLVAAWRSLEEGPILDEVCALFEQMKHSGLARPDASLGMIRSQRVADRLRESGVECYNHNLETSRRFFPQICTTHSFDDRLATIQHLKQAGIMVCSGGILGMGETREDRCDLAFALRELRVDFVPLNFLNPIAGTPLARQPAMPPLEILKSIACFRFILPKQEIMVAGGRAVNLRDLQSMIFMAGASALMIGNYLTTTGRPADQDLQMIKDLGLDPEWEPKH